MCEEVVLLRKVHLLYYLVKYIGRSATTLLLDASLYEQVSIHIRAAY